MRWMRQVVRLHLCARRRLVRSSYARLIRFDVCSKPILVSDVGDFPVDAVIISVAVTAVNFMGVITALLFPLFTTVVIFRFIAVTIGIEVMGIRLACENLLTRNLERYHRKQEKR